MRIVIDARYLRAEYTGIGIYSQGLVEALGRHDSVNDYVILVHNSFRGDLELPGNFEVVEDPALPLSVRTMTTLYSTLAKMEPDIFHSLFPLAPVAWRGKLALTVHDLQPLADPDFTAMRSAPKKMVYDLFYRLAYPWSMRSADCLLTDSYATKEVIRRFVPDVVSKTLVVHAGIPKESFEVPTEDQIEQVKERLDIPDRFLFYLGSTRPNKNLSVMMDAFEEYLKRNPDDDDLKWVLVLKPDRFFDPFFAQIRDRGLLRRIHIHEQITELEKRVFYRLATLLYFVTKHEGFGLPVLEAQAQDLPVLVSNHGALPEVTGRAGLFCDPDDPESIVEALELYLQGKADRTQLIEAGRANLQHFSWDKAAREVLDMYNHVLS